jgi:hypothetical protein
MNYLIGAISGNYGEINLRNWVKSSDIPGVKRVLFYYNPSNEGLINYCKENNIEVVIPTFNLYNNPVHAFIADSGSLTEENSEILVHHIRFFHWFLFLKDLNENDLILLTDVNDVVFNGNPFEWLESKNHKGIVASSEEVIHANEEWNLLNYYTTFGIITSLYTQTKIYNAGTIAGTAKEVSDLCKDIYLLTLHKSRNADQAAYNYLIQNSYKDKTLFTDLNDKWGVHLHLVNQNKVQFDLNTIDEYKIIHQYDRIDWLKRQVFDNYSL